MARSHFLWGGGEPSSSDLLPRFGARVTTISLPSFLLPLRSPVALARCLERVNEQGGERRNKPVQCYLSGLPSGHKAHDSMGVKVLGVYKVRSKCLFNFGLL